MEGGHALTVTRLFSSMQLQPYDVRYVALRCHPSCDRGFFLTMLHRAQPGGLGRDV